MTVFIIFRISIFAVGNRALDGVIIPAVLGGGVTPTCVVSGEGSDLR